MILDIHTIYEVIFHNVTVGHHNVNIPQFLPAEPSQFPGFFAEAQCGPFRQFQSENRNDHTPNAAVLIGRDSSGLAVDCQFAESLL